MLQLFALPLAFVGGHASLHPADSTFFFEVPDLPALESAYANAPLMKLLADSEWNGFAARALDADPAEFQLADWCCEYFEESFTSIEALAGSDVNMRDACRGLKAFSISMSAPEIAAPLEEALAEPANEGVVVEDFLARVGGVLILDYADAESAQRGLDFCVGALQLIPDEVQHKQAPLNLLGQAGLAQHYRHTNPGPLPSIWSATCGSSVVIGMGTVTPERWRSLADKPQAQLASNARFHADASAMRTDGGVEIYDAFVDVTGISAAFETIQQYEELDSFEGLISALRTALPDDSFSSRCRASLAGDRFRRESQSTGMTLVKGLGVAPVSRRAVEYLQPGTMGAWATSMRAEDFEPLLVEAFARCLETDANGARRFFSETAGIDLSADLLAPLGGSAAAFVMPFAGPALPEFGLILELEDHERFKASMDKLFTAVTERFGDAYESRDGNYRGQALYSMTSTSSAANWDLPDLGPANMLLDVLRPGIAIAVMEDRVLISLERRFVTREVKRVLKPEEGAPVHPLAAAEAPFPNTATCVSICDWGAGLGSLYELARTLVNMLGGASLGIDASALPSTESLTRHFQPSLSWTTRTDGVTRSYSESSFGPEATLLLSGLIGLGVYESMDMFLVEDVEATPLAEPVPEPTDPSAGDR